MKILIIQTASIGDVILTTPILEALHDHYPGVSVDIVVKKGNEGILYGHPYLQQIYTWDKDRNKYQNYLKIIRRIRKAGYDEVIIVHRFFSSGMMALLSKAKITTGFHKNPLSLFFTHRIQHTIGDHQVHEVDRNLSLLKHMGIKGSYPVRIYPSPRDEQQVAFMATHPYICIAPSSLWFTKQYPEERWTALLDRIPERIACYIIGGPQDRPLAERIQNKTTHPAVHVVTGDFSLTGSAVLMKGAIMNFTNDSAPTHLASALNAPVTTVYCSTIPAFGFGPLSDNANIVEVNQPLSCRPCGLHGRKKCPEKHFNCARLIHTEDLINKIPL